MKARIRNLTPTAVFSAVITVFYLLFTKLILKSDDGHFLGILQQPGFRLLPWIAERYRTISGRTFCELLTASFLSLPLVFWKLFCAGLWIVFVRLLIRFLAAFGKMERTEQIFACCIPFCVLLTCLNPAAFWFSGSFTFLIPFICSVICCTPAVFTCYEIAYRRIPVLILASVCAVVACSQEQSAAITLSLLLLCLIGQIRNKTFRATCFIPILPAGVETFFLFSAPGMRERMAAEASAFPRFAEMRFAQKALCGLSHYAGHEMLRSLAVFTVFALLLGACAKRCIPGRTGRTASRLFVGLWGIVCIAANAGYCLLRRTFPVKGFQQAFLSGTFGICEIVMIGLCLTLLVFTGVLLALIVRHDAHVGLPTAVCWLASVCSGAVMGFSSSVYASGQRIFFFSDMFLLIGACILYVQTENGTGKTRIGNAILLLAVCTLLIDCFSFLFMETPIMG